MLEMVTAFEKASGKVLSMLNRLYHLFIILYLLTTNYLQKIPLKFCPRRPGDATEVYASTDKAASELDWK